MCILIFLLKMWAKMYTLYTAKYGSLILALNCKTGLAALGRMVNNIKSVTTRVSSW